MQQRPQQAGAVLVAQRHREQQLQGQLRSVPTAEFHVWELNEVHQSAAATVAALVIICNAAGRSWGGQGPWCRSQSRHHSSDSKCAVHLRGGCVAVGAAAGCGGPHHRAGERQQRVRAQRGAGGEDVRHIAAADGVHGALRCVRFALGHLWPAGLAAVDADQAAPSAQMNQGSTDVAPDALLQTCSGFCATLICISPLRGQAATTSLGWTCLLNARVNRDPDEDVRVGASGLGRRAAAACQAGKHTDEIIISTSAEHRRKSQHLEYA